MRLEWREIVDEQLDQLGRLIVIGVLVSPGLARIEDRAVDARNGNRHFEPEVRIGAEFGIVQATVERRVQERAGGLDRHAAAGTIFAAGPAGVEQPALNPALGDPLLQQIAVDAGVARHERRTETGGEGGFRLGHADLRAGHLCGIARQEVVHGLLRRQPRDRGEHAKGVGGQHDYILRHRTEIVFRRVGNEVDRIGTAAVFGQAGIVQIQRAGLIVHDDIFQHRAEPAGGGINLRLGLFAQADHLGIAAALEIEDRAVGPAMLVIADQRTAGIGGQRGLAGAGETEEHGGVALRTDIGAAMHRHHALGRQQIVEQAEHALLHFAGITGAADQDQFFAEIDRDHRFSARAMTRRVRLERGQIDHGIFGGETGQLVLGRAAQHRADEQIMPRKFVDHAHGHTMLGLRSAEQVLAIEPILLAQRLEEIFLQIGEMLRRHGRIIVPPDRVLGLAIAHDKLVLGGAAGMRAGFHHQRAVLGQPAFTMNDGRFHQRAALQVPVALGRNGKPLIGQRNIGGSGRGLGHGPVLFLRHGPRTPDLHDMRCRRTWQNVRGLGMA